ncbi:cupin domain-containing protein [Rhizobium sp. C4]|uniref:cupin domain-containing protein n=1 Tax=Rhizobium sp. C4 TaxID=1349800 RepID=UPI001E3236DD|nr:cupin domain-containing protein [Rhizobium sp. C4]MCD2175337.1 cupin domain-containing protein [Rhizobium sp. C4]
MALVAGAKPFLDLADVPPLVAASSGAMEMKAAPIDPAWIVAGAPQARIAEHSQSSDRAAMTALWDCTAGTFRWYFAWDETVMILEGEVRVTDANGAVRVLKAGDIAYFTGNTWATWQIDNYVRKIAFLRRPFPLPVALAYRLKGKLAGLIKRPLRSAL